MRHASIHIAASLLLFGATSVAVADARGDVRVIVLRGETFDTTIGDRVDGILLASLLADAGFGEAHISPIPLADLRLAAGCGDESQSCVSRIADLVDAEVVLVRDLRADGGLDYLTLTSFDAIGAGAPVFVEQALDAGPPETVPHMVRVLYPPEDRERHAPVRVLPQSYEAGRDAGSGPQISTLTWTSLGLGAAAVGAATIFAVMASDAFSESDGRRGHEELSTARDRSLAAHVLFGAGGLLLGVGATLLVLDLARDGDAPIAIAVGVAPDGGMVALRGATGVL